jgi:hypothetical protein
MDSPMKYKQPRYLPEREEIDEMCAAIQKEWTPLDEQRRRVVKSKPTEIKTPRVSQCEP